MKHQADGSPVEEHQATAVETFPILCQASARLSHAMVRSTRAKPRRRRAADEHDVRFVPGSRADRCRPLFFGALDALAFDDTGDWAGLPSGQLTTPYIEGVVDTAQRGVVPAAEVVIHRAARRQ